MEHLQAIGFLLSEQSLLSYLYERRSQGRTTLNQIKERIKAYREDLIEMDFRNLFLNNKWIDFYGSDGSAAITTDGIREIERRSSQGGIT